MEKLKRIEDFEGMALGMFVHWGLYAQMGRGEWIMHQELIPKEEYSKLKNTFTAEDYIRRNGLRRQSRLAPSIWL